MPELKVYDKKQLNSGTNIHPRAETQIVYLISA